MRTNRLIVGTTLAALLVGTALVGVAFAQKKLSHGQAENEARKLWAIGDQLRRKNDYEKAVKAYERSVEVLALSEVNGSTGDKTTLGMAGTQMAEFCKAMPIDVKKLADGTYEGTAWGYQAQMKVKVLVEGGKIKNFWVVEQKESSPRKALEVVPRLIYRKNHPSVDAVSRATVTSYGLMTATLRALQQAKPAEEKPADAKTDEKKPEDVEIGD